MSDTILNPIYSNTVYQYHRCSECNAKIDLEERYGDGFKEEYKYCPFCGKKIVRYGKPVYKNLPDWSWMEKFNKILRNANRQLEYEILCNMTEEQRKDLIDKAEFGIKYFGSSLLWYGNSAVCEIVKDIAYKKPHYTYKRKLENEFGGK